MWEGGELPRNDKIEREKEFVLGEGRRIDA